MDSAAVQADPRSGGPWPRHLAAYALAFAWPWAVYETLPTVFFPLSALLAAALVVAAARDLLRGERLALPFELAWPLLLLVAVSVAHGLLRQEWSRAMSAVGGALCFASVVQTVRARDAVRHCLWLSAIAGGAAALVSLFVHYRPFHGLVLYSVFPTAFSTQTGATLAFPATLGEGALILCLCLVLALGTVCSKEYRRWQRLTALFAVIPLAAALAVIARLNIEWLLARWNRPWTVWTESTELTGWGAALVILWLLARIAAKLHVVREADPSGTRRALVVLLAVGGALAVGLSMPPRTGYAFLLALAACYAFPRREREVAASAAPAWCCVLILPLIAWNILHVDVRNSSDPRNYEAFAVKYLESDPYLRLATRLEFINRRSPAERRTYYWEARAHLAKNNFEGATTAFRKALAPPGPGRPLLPPPAGRQVDEFLGLLRDKCSALPLDERGLACERALVAVGRPEDALALLRFRAEGHEALVCPTTALAQGLADLLGDRSLAETLAAWNAGELVRLFEQAGAHVGPAPARFPRRFLPAVGIAHWSDEEASLRVYAAGRHAGARATIESCGQIVGNTCYWRNPRRARDGVWDGAWVWPLTLDRGERAGAIRFDGGIECVLTSPEHRWAPVSSYSPSVGVLMP